MAGAAAILVKILPEEGPVKFIVATYGTEGDTRPFAALCRGLKDAGHEAHLLADAATLGAAHALGVPATALSGDIRSALHAEQDAIARGGGFKEAARVLAKIANDNAESWLRAILETGEGCDAVVTAGLAAFVGFSASEFLGARTIAAGMIPITPTTAFPSPFLPSRMPRLLNRVSHSFVNAMLWKAFREKTNAARSLFHMPPRKALWKGLPMIYGISPALLPRPSDWPANVHLCGQWLPPAPAWMPPPALASFLAGGEAPVYIGFGSMTGFDHFRLLDTMVHALSGRRALFYPGWSGIDPIALPPNLFVIGDTPHDWLFPRTAAVIYHGGSGTSHSAARAGVPSIVIPFAGDQFFWAERLRLAGVAPAALNGRRLNPESLRRALDVAGSNPVRNRAQALGEIMRKEDGIANAIAALERMVTG